MYCITCGRSRSGPSCKSAVDGMPSTGRQVNATAHARLSPDPRAMWVLRRGMGCSSSSKIEQQIRGVAPRVTGGGEHALQDEDGRGPARRSLAVGRRGNSIKRRYIYLSEGVHAFVFSRYPAAASSSLLAVVPRRPPSSFFLPCPSPCLPGSLLDWPPI